MDDNLLDGEILSSREGLIGQFFYGETNIVQEKFKLNKLRIGYTQKRYMGAPRVDFWLDVGESFGIVILGMRGSGKTYLTRRLVDEAHNSNKNMKQNFHIVYLTDVKNEMVSSLKQANYDQKQFLPEGELPRPTPVRCFYPAYLGDPPPLNQKFQMSILNLHASDLINLYGGDERSFLQKDILTEIYRKIDHGEVSNMDEILNSLEKNKEISGGTKTSLKVITKSLKRNNVLGDDFNVNIADVFNSGEIPVLNLVGHERMGIHISSAFVAVFLRKVVEAKKYEIRDNKPMMVIIDEAHEFVNEKRNLASKEQILHTLRTERGAGISMVCISQSLTSIPFEIIENSRYIFIPQGYGVENLKDILKRTIGVRWSPRVYNKIVRISKSLRRRGRQREWLLIDRQKPKKPISFFPYAPTSLHKSETRW